MSTLTWKKKRVSAAQDPAAPKTSLVFPYGGQELPDGSVLYRVRYQILYDGYIDPSGVFWTKTVPPKASTADYMAAQEERNEAIKRLTQLVTPPSSKPRRAFQWKTKKA